MFAIRESLTADEYGEVLRRGWIEQHEDACFYLPYRVQVLEELRTAAAAEDFKSAEVDHAFGVDDFAPYHRYMEAGDDPVVGASVAVLEGGVEYTGSVQGVNPDGTLRISFGGDRKPSRDAYAKSEVRVVQPIVAPPLPPANAVNAPATRAAPTAPGTTVSPMGGGGPVAPGLAAR